MDQLWYADKRVRDRELAFYGVAQMDYWKWKEGLGAGAIAARLLQRACAGLIKYVLQRNCVKRAEFT